MTPKIRKWIGIAVLTPFALAVLIGGGTYLWYRYTVAQSQPVTDGDLQVAGLRQEVEILRDDFGIPHIYAENPRDLYLAMGYAMAQDRLWQMEFFRRLGSGRLSELFGKKTLEADRLFRSLALAQEEIALPPEVAFIPEAFAAGINAYLQRTGERLPLEFKLLDHRPDPWTETDYLAVFRVVQWGLSLGWKVDRTAARVLAAVGEDRFREAFPPATDDTPVIRPGEAAEWKNLPVAPDEIAARCIPAPGFRPSAASNNWVVSASKSQSGFPILANDTHMALSNPSLWWEVHLVCPPKIDAAGFAIPGLPGIPIGHNAQAAWGITNVMLDDVDFYIEKIHPDDPRRCRFENRWYNMRVIDTELRVRGEKPEPLQVKLTRHGPVLQEYESAGEPRAMSVRWSALELNPPTAAAHGLIQADGLDALISALSRWDLPGQNFVFADRAGNIGFWCCAAIPIRKNGSGMLPLNGWEADNEWQGFVPFDQRPHLINPAAGYIASANNPVAGSRYRFSIGNYWESADRIFRIRNRLEAAATFSVETLRSIQVDVYNPLADELVPVVISALSDESLSASQQAALEVLQSWDRRMERGSAGALIFEATYLRVLDGVFRRALGPELFRQYLDTMVFPPRALRRIIRSESSAWLKSAGASPAASLAVTAAVAFRQAVSELGRRFGNDPASWRWGKAHTLSFSHVLAAKKPLGALFNLGPFPAGGSGLTINKKAYDYQRPFEVKEGVSQRMLIDLSDPWNARHVLPTGQSGVLHNAHYRDQIDLYLKGADRVMPMQRADVEARCRGRLRLSPR